MAAINDYDTKRSKALKWGYLFAGVAFVVFVVFLARILILQHTNVQNFEDNYINKNYREAKLQAARGNLFASDGSIFATTVMRYDAYVDFKTIKDSIYNKNIGALTDSLSAMFGKPRAHYRKIFDEEKKIEIWAYNIETVMDEKIETIEIKPTCCPLRIPEIGRIDKCLDFYQNWAVTFECREYHRSVGILALSE